MKKLIVEMQVHKVRDIVIERKITHNHGYLDTLLKKLDKLSELLSQNNFEEINKNPRVRGALRAYLETNLVKSFEEPLVIELDKLELMFDEPIKP